MSERKRQVSIARRLVLLLTGFAVTAYVLVCAMAVVRIVAGSAIPLLDQALVSTQEERNGLVGGQVERNVDLSHHWLLEVNVDPPGSGQVTFSPSPDVLEPTDTGYKAYYRSHWAARSIALVAHADTEGGYKFTEWTSGPAAGVTRTCTTFDLRDSATVDAEFRATYDLSLHVPYGRVTATPPGRECFRGVTLLEYGNPDADPSVTKVEEVTLTNAEAPGLFVDHWLVDGVSTHADNQSITLTMDRDHDVTPVVVTFYDGVDLGAPVVRLRTSVAGDGAISIEHDAANQALDATVSGRDVQYPAKGFEVTLTPKPGPGHRFSHWLRWTAAHAEILATPTLTESTSCSLTIVAIFIADAFDARPELVVERDGAGEVKPFPNLYRHDSGTVVPLEARPETGWVFTKWVNGAGGTVSTESSHNLTLTGDMTVRALFEPEGAWGGDYDVDWHELIVLVDGSGEVTPHGRFYPSGTKVTLTATANGRAVFKGWWGDYLGGRTGPTQTFRLNSTALIKAVFEPRQDN